MTAPFPSALTGYQPGGSATTTDATTAYRAAKKALTAAAGRVGALEAEIGTLASRKAQMQQASRDCSLLDIVTARTADKLTTAAQGLEKARSTYRVAHLELLMTPGPQRHYIDSISRQRLIARIADDDNETAILTAMQNTLALVLGLMMQRKSARKWAIQTTQDTDAREILTEMKSAASQTLSGIYRSASGAMTEVIRLSNGRIGTSEGPLAPIPYDYLPGVPFHDGHLILNSAVTLQRQVEPAAPTGYSAACSVIT